MSRAAAVAPTPSPWIVGRRYDQLFLLAAWCVPLALFAVALAVPYGFLIALAAFVLLDNSHQVATLPLTILDPATMRKAGPTYLAGAAAIGGAAAAISFFPGSLVARMWASLVVYWGGWHIVRQHYGFLRLYQARDAPPDARLARAEVVALYSGAAFPYCLNLSHGWAGEGLEAMLYRVPVPTWSAWVVLAIFAASLAYLLQAAIARAAGGGRAINVRLLHVVLVVTNFWIGILWLGRDDLVMAVLIITSYHDLQYHAVVWLVGRRRARASAAEVRPTVRRLFASVPAFAAAVAAGAVVQALLRNDFQLAGSVVPPSAATGVLFAVVGSYSYMHYFFDGKMWKLSTDARLREELGLRAAASARRPR